MQESDVRKYAEAHADAVKAGDMTHLMADFVPEALSAAGATAGDMPNPVTSTEVKSVELQGDKAVCHIAYTGSDKTVTIRSVWVEADGRPKIAEVAIA